MKLTKLVSNGTNNKRQITIKNLHEEAIAEHRMQHLHISEGWWPHHTSGITRLLWEDLGNWCPGLWKKACLFVAQCYQWDPENHWEQNIEIARHLLGNGGLFLKNGVDDEGHANNLAHLALAGLIIDFFIAALPWSDSYSQKSSLQRFQELPWLLLQQPLYFLHY
ncbi:hypothetical protein EDD15DRAFT_2364815 [Pisolithus albus]|nr:hypothetical protein EDD15DRAFT_2364815 [Pisolithus albus]